MSKFRMPSLGADMDAGTLLEWLVKPGDEVHRGDIVAVVDTDKAAIDVETFADGVVQRLLVEPGTRVPVGAPLADIGAASGEAKVLEPVGAPLADIGAVSGEAQALEPVGEVAGRGGGAVTGRGGGAVAGRGGELGTTSPEPSGDGRPTVGPVLRHLAETLGVDLHLVTGTGRGGRITRADIAHAAEVNAPVAETEGPPTAAATEKPAASAALPPEAAAAEEPPTTAPAEPPRVRPAAHEERARISPYARRRAAELGIDLAGVVSEASAAAIHAVDIEAVASAADKPVPGPVTSRGTETVEAASPAAKAATAAERSAAMRRAIAKLMSRSNAEVPHYYVTTTIDVSRSVDWLREHNAGVPVAARIVMAAVFAKATARAAAEVPGLNGWWVDGEFRASERVHLGIPVSLREGGLATPAIREADTLELPEVMARLRDLVDRARRGSLRASELTDATLTMTNLGDRGAESVQGVIYPPQVALVGFGRVVQRPWAVDGLIGVRPLVTVTLAGDHRASDGHLGGLVLEVIDRLLTHPEVL